ncbi:unnamed protein product [Chrysodeixis includens]|uniref:Carboxylic ester hydrolase n=1 Tax=Chrysodeixis includens TaxID=689277 RepID=A0A9N8KVW4_CHRIL|nr:unnamed protein product [Chrysodeixis includens]CAD0201643.1 unnamed protein product [Chrysodeixis includens]
MVTVKVQQGWLSGEQLKTAPEGTPYFSFKGIPYAAPPVGKLRFKAPQPPLPWEGIRKATEHGPRCPQVDIFTQETIVSSEDCLNLNVYSPDIAPDSPLPVLFFIHGGGFKGGSGNQDRYTPDFLMSHGIILVTINYRLDALGFLCLDTEEVPGNAGMKDQVAALRWVRDNIASFGGDPNNVTVSGESAGGASTCYHLLSPMSKGLFKKAISMSGAPVCDWATPFEPRNRAFLFGRQLGLNTKDPQELLDFLQNLPVEKLLNNNPALLSFEDHNNHLYKHYHFIPVVEKDFGGEHFLTVHPMQALKDKNINDADLFIGYANEETLTGIDNFMGTIEETFNKYPELVVPKKILISSTPETILKVAELIRDHYFKGANVTKDNVREFVSFANATSFVTDINRFITHLPRVGKGKRYMYRFSTVSKRNVHGNAGAKYGVVGAGHMDVLMYLMDAQMYDLKTKKNSREFELITLVCTVFSNFVKYGNPTPDSSLGAVWPEYDNASKRYVDIGDTLTVASSPDAEAVSFWRSIFEYVGHEY